MSVKVNLRSHDMNDMQNYSRIFANYFIIGFLMECMDFVILQDVTITTLKGMLDSLKGPYWLYSLDSIQSQAHSDRLQFQNVNVKQNISKRARKE